MLGGEDAADDLRTEVVRCELHVVTRPRDGAWRVKWLEIERVDRDGCRARFAHDHGELESETTAQDRSKPSTRRGSTANGHAAFDVRRYASLPSAQGRVSAQRSV